MDKLNKQFMDDPVGFMSVHPIDIPPESKLTKEAPKTGVHEFDLRYGSLGEVLLDLMADRGKAVGKRTNAIEAYWLPWEPGGAATMKVGRDANFFFTSALAGCRIQVFPGETPTHCGAHRRRHGGIQMARGASQEGAGRQLRARALSHPRNIMARAGLPSLPGSGMKK